MDWTKITDNAEVIKLLKQRTEIENKIKAIDKIALIMYELELLSIPSVVGQSEQLFCFNCKHHEDIHKLEPCNNCFDLDKFEAK